MSNSESELYDKLQAEYKQARKTKDEDAVSALAGLIDKAQKLAKSAKDAEKRIMTDDYVQLAARTETSELAETLESYVKAGREAEAGSFHRKLAILEAYKPQALGIEEIKAAIREFADGNPLVTSKPQAGMGIVIGKLKERYGNRFDSKAMSPLVKEMLGA